MSTPVTEALTPANVTTEHHLAGYDRRQREDAAQAGEPTPRAQLGVLDAALLDDAPLLCPKVTNQTLFDHVDREQPMWQFMVAARSQLPGLTARVTSAARAAHDKDTASKLWSLSRYLRWLYTVDYPVTLSPVLDVFLDRQFWLPDGYAPGWESWMRALGLHRLPAATQTLRVLDLLLHTGHDPAPKSRERQVLKSIQAQERAVARAASFYRESATSATFSASERLVEAWDEYTALDPLLVDRNRLQGLVVDVRFVQDQGGLAVWEAQQQVLWRLDSEASLILDPDGPGRSLRPVELKQLSAFDGTQEVRLVSANPKTPLPKVAPGARALLAFSTYLARGGGGRRTDWLNNSWQELDPIRRDVPMNIALAGIA